MYILFRVLFGLSFFVTSICLTVPTFDRAMSWNEAAPGVILGLFFMSLWALLSVVVAPGRFKNDAFGKGQWRRRAGITFGAIGVVYCLTFGTAVAVACQRSIDKADAQSYSRTSYGSSYRSGYGGSYGGYDSGAYLRSRYRDYDETGRGLGIFTAALTILPLVFLIVSIAWKPKPQAAAFASMPPSYQPSWPPQPMAYGGPPSGQGYPPPAGGFGGPPSGYGGPPGGYGPAA